MSKSSFMRTISIISAFCLMFMFLPALSPVSAAPSFVVDDNITKPLQIELTTVDTDDENGETPLESRITTTNYYKAMTFNVNDVSKSIISIDQFRYKVNSGAFSSLEDVYYNSFTIEDIFLANVLTGGIDTITIEVNYTDASSAPATESFAVNIDTAENYSSSTALLLYNDGDEPGAMYRTLLQNSISTVGAFDGAVNFTFPNNSFIKSINDNRIYENQYVEIAADHPDNTEVYVFQSNAFRFEPIYDDAAENLKPSSPGSITIHYNSDINPEVALYNLSIVKLDSFETEWIPIGGIVDTKKKIVTAPITDFGTYALALSYKTYTDLADWSKPYVMALAYKGIIVPDHGTDSGNLKYEINEEISRYDFTVMLAKALGYTPVEYDSTLFDDMYDIEDIYFGEENGLDYIMAAVKNGLVQGQKSTDGARNLFGPNDPLLRMEAAVFVSRAMKLDVETYSDFEKVKKALYKTYTKEDVDNTPGWAMPAIAAATKAKVLNGDENRQFNATDTLTFEEASALIYKLMDQMKLFGK